MKPKIGVVFPKITDKDIADLEIEKIRVSKNRRKIGILLGSDTSAYQQAKVESEVKKQKLKLFVVYMSAMISIQQN